MTADERRDELGRIISGDFFRRRSVNTNSALTRTVHVSPFEPNCRAVLAVSVR